MLTIFGITLCLWYNFNLCKLSNMKFLSKQKNKIKTVLSLVWQLTFFSFSSMWWNNVEVFKHEINQKEIMGNVLVEMNLFLTLTFTSSKIRNYSGNSLCLFSWAVSIQTVPLTSTRFLRQIMVEHNELCQYCKIKEGQDFFFNFEAKRNSFEYSHMTLHWFCVSSGLHTVSLYSHKEVHLYTHTGIYVHVYILFSGFKHLKCIRSV